MSSSSKGEELIFYALVGGPALLAFGLASLREKRIIERTPTSKVRSAAMGFVELKGQAKAKVELLEPLAKLPCCWWRCRVQEYRSNGKNSRWVTVKETFSTELFYLEDETGKVLVDPREAELYVDERTVDFDSLNRADLGPVLAGWSVDSSSWFGGSKTMRILEATIDLDRPLYVLGDLVRREGEAGLPEADKTVVRKPADRPFIVSSESEQQLVARFGLKAGLMVVGGIAAAGAGTAMALGRGISQEWTAVLVAAGFCAGMGAWLLFGKDGTRRMSWDLSFWS